MFVLSIDRIVTVWSRIHKNQSTDTRSISWFSARLNTLFWRFLCGFHLCFGEFKQSLNLACCFAENLEKVWNFYTNCCFWFPPNDWHAFKASKRNFSFFAICNTVKSSFRMILTKTHFNSQPSIRHWKPLILKTCFVSNWLPFSVSQCTFQPHRHTLFLYKIIGLRIYIFYHISSILVLSDYILNRLGKYLLSIFYFNIMGSAEGIRFFGGKIILNGIIDLRFLRAIRTESESWLWLGFLLLKSIDLSLTKPRVYRRFRRRLLQAC